MVEFRASHRHAQITARKARLVADLVRGLPVNQALNVLERSPKRAAARPARASTTDARRVASGCGLPARPAPGAGPARAADRVAVRPEGVGIQRSLERDVAPGRHRRGQVRARRAAHRQKLGDRTCCVSGTANRNGIPSITVDQINTGGIGGNKDQNKNNQNNNNNNKDQNNNNKDQNNNNQDKGGGKNNNNNNQNNNQNTLPNNNIFNQPKGRKLLMESKAFRALLQSVPPTPTPTPTVGATSAVTQDDVRLRAVSYNDPRSNVTTQNVVVIAGKDAGERAQYLVQVAADTKTESTNYYDRIERAAFWFGCLLGAGIIINGVSYMFVKCCEGEVPGVLYLPRILLMVVLVSLTGFSFAGALLFSGGGGLGPVLVGILVVLFYPVLFLIAAFIGIAAAVYRKRKAVYLLSSRASTDEAEVNKWDKRVVANWMGMSLNRGKWRPTDPSKKNEFVFRWGPLFEDCRGPLFQRKKGEATHRRRISKFSKATAIG